MDNKREELNEEFSEKSKHFEIKIKDLKIDRIREEDENLDNKNRIIFNELIENFLLINEEILHKKNKVEKYKNEINLDENVIKVLQRNLEGIFDNFDDFKIKRIKRS